jgi:branched-chain amino acid transport system ATP-binding protein
LAFLEVHHLRKSFGGLAALSDLAFDVNQGEILGLIGPNGAGKTTLFNVITGIYKPTGGRILFKGENLVGLAPYEIAKRGVARTFQSTILYHEMTVLENVLVGAHVQMGFNFVDSLLGSRAYRAKEKESVDKALQIIDFMGLNAMAAERAKNLPHGHQRKLGVCIALITRPELLLLDEPMTGMNPVESADMIGHIRRIQGQLGITVVLIEHNMRAVMGVSNRIVAIHNGEKIAEGLPQEIREHDGVVEAYLGREEGDETECLLN